MHPLDPQVSSDPQIQMLCGWRRNDAEVNRILSQKRHPTFQTAAPHLKNYWQGESIGLWQATKKVNNNQHLPADKQGIGDCVSHGHARAVDYLFCVKQASGLVSDSGIYKEGTTSAMSEAIYGDCREIGNDLGYQDGAVGIWAIEALQRDGYAIRNGKPYDSGLAKQYGARGCPSDLKNQGKVRTLEQYSKLQTPDDAANALKAGCPITVCTGLGFAMTRDSNGICRRQGRWGHCMACVGLYVLDSRRIYVLLQSWGQNTPDGPIPAGGEAPDNSFGIEESDMASILREDDSYALAGIKGFQPLPPLTWIM